MGQQVANRLFIRKKLKVCFRSRCPKINLQGHKSLEREQLGYLKGDEKVNFTRHFLMLGKVTLDKQVHILKMKCKGDISYTITIP